MKKILVLAAAAISLSACSTLGQGESGFSSYAPVSVRRVSVGDGSLSVAPPRPWNRQRASFFTDVRVVEDWTLNGPYLDGISFVSGLRNNRYLVYQRRSASQQVPPFRSNMTPPEIATMVESLFRVRGGTVDFRTLGIQPRPFLGTNGFQIDYEHLDSDELWRKGRAVGAVINGRLYLILVDAARSHYYSTVLPDFEAIVASARVRA
ncbi:MAG: hypothetical protein ACJ8FL_01760 [Sphingomicrobium sp.]